MKIQRKIHKSEIKRKDSTTGERYSGKKIRKIEWMGEGMVSRESGKLERKISVE